MHYSLPYSFFLFFGIQNKIVVGSIDVCQHSLKKKRGRKRKKNTKQAKTLLVLPIVCEIFFI